MSQNEKLLLGEAVRYFYKTRRLSVRDMAVLVKADNPNLAIDCFLRYRLYLEIKEDKVVYKKNVFRKLVILGRERTFNQVFVVCSALYLVSSFVGLFLLSAAWNQFSEILFLLKDDSLNGPWISASLEGLLILTMAVWLLCAAYYSLEGVGRPPQPSYVHRVFSEVEKSSSSDLKSGFLSRLFNSTPFGLADRD